MFADDVLHPKKKKLGLFFYI